MYNLIHPLIRIIYIHLHIEIPCLVAFLPLVLTCIIMKISIFSHYMRIKIFIFIY